MAFNVIPTTCSKIGETRLKLASTLRIGEEKNLSEENFSFSDLITSKFGSIEVLKERADGEDCEAQLYLSMAYEEGFPELGIEKDLAKAMNLAESANRNGDNSSTLLTSLAILYDRQGTVAHQRKAYELHLKAAKFGQIPSQLNLAEMYRCGVEGVVDKNLEEAFKWYRRAAGEELKEFDAESVLHPSHYVQGNLRNLCALDYKFVALKCLHKFYMCGDCPEGKPQPVKALYYLKKAAEIGDPEQKDLGLAYLTGGSGYPKDLDKAKRWLGKAAKNGQQEAKQVLDKLNAGKIVDCEADTDQTDIVDAAKQYADILSLEIDQNKHPYVIPDPMIFHEDMFTKFPDSPTAQLYLKAFQLVKKGLEIIMKSEFTDPEGIKLFAQGYLYENSILQSFLLIRKEGFVSCLFAWIDQILEKNPTFFEGLVVMSALTPHNMHFNFESCKIDLRRTMALSNLIHLIKKAEPDKPPKQDPYNFEEDYTSWLHVLYYFLGSNFIITNCYKDGAEAFDMALKCCPNYFEAKLALGHCLMNLKFAKHQREYVSNDTEKLLEMFAIPKNQRILKGDYLSWTDHQLRQRAKQLFMEYIEEAPECNKKYQDGYYHLAVLYMREGNNEEAVKWKEKGEDSEEKRLPFMEPFHLATKALLAPLDMYSSSMTRRTCNNRKCRNKRRGKSTLQLCRCRAVSYCGRECQAEDKEHKKTCSAKKKR